MRLSKFLIPFLLLLTFCTSYPQTKPIEHKIKISGIVVDKKSNQPLEYATISFLNLKSSKVEFGGITDSKGKFSIELKPGQYDIKIEFISFKPIEIKQKNLQQNTDLGTIMLDEDASQLNEVIVRSDKSKVEIKLDKKIYSIGKDFMVKGGTISDVLDNIPSVSVDQDGVVSLRGNPDVRIFIDGRPTNAVNIAEVLKTISADAIDKVEVISNPSARYESEGSAGILNIILKKGKNKGLNGSIIGTAGYPENYGLSLNANYKLENINFTTVIGTIDKSSPGNSITNTQYLNEDGSTKKYINETRDNQKINKGFNAIFGADWSINESTTWMNNISLRNTTGDYPETAQYNNYDQNYQYISTDYRNSQVNNENKNFEYNTNLSKKFKKEGHKITMEASINSDVNNEYSKITSSTIEATTNNQTQNRSLFQLDYVLPINKNGQFEAGYKGNFNNLTSENSIDSLDINGGNIPLSSIKSTFEYIENINALYTQYGSKINQFSGLIGLRWEASDLNINELVTQDYNQKKYNNFFPNIILNYEISENTNTSFSYSKRINRPRGRLINPFTNYTSNINIFRGNPDLNPSFTDAFNIEYIKRWEKLTLDTSLYYNITSDGFQFIRIETGRYVLLTPGDPNSLTPVILTTPINLANEYRLGYELTLNYNPFKWLRLNGNFNMFSSDTQGDFSYINLEGKTIYQNFDTNTFGWISRLTSRFILPYKTDLVINTSYNGPQKTIQGNSIGIFGANLSITKDILKDKGTLSLNIQDVFNSRKRKYETYIPGVLNSYSEMQRQVRQVNLSFTYRFNKKKEDKEKQPKKESEEGEF